MIPFILYLGKGKTIMMKNVSVVDWSLRCVKAIVCKGARREVLRVTKIFYTLTVIVISDYIPLPKLNL